VSVEGLRDVRDESPRYTHTHTPPEMYEVECVCFQRMMEWGGCEALTWMHTSSGICAARGGRTESACSVLDQERGGDGGRWRCGVGHWSVVLHVSTLGSGADLRPHGHLICIARNNTTMTVRGGAC
jgi:hypothetical protein